MNQVNIVKRTSNLFCPACGDHTSLKLANKESPCRHVIYTFDDGTQEFNQIEPNTEQYINQVIKSQKKRHQKLEEDLKNKRNIGQAIKEIQKAPSPIDELSELMWSTTTMHIGIEVMSIPNTTIFYVGYDLEES